MTIKKLKELISELPDDMKVLVPTYPTEGFTGHFFSPCDQDSGESEIGGDESMTEEEIETAANLGTLQSEKVFLLLPCGFDEEKDHTHELN